jgi:hypothetical protein
MHSAFELGEYLPAPIVTDGVQVPKEIINLRELLARNAHEVWALQRLKQGWTWGPVRDDAGKKHPCLIPYEQLPDSEKEFDRATAVETIKAIISLGFRISPPIV